MTHDQDNSCDPIPVVTANCPELVREALKMALMVEPQLAYKGDLRIDLASPRGYGNALANFPALMSDGVLILILYVSEEVQRLPNIFAHLLEEYAGLRVLVIAGPLSESSITAYWMSLRWSKLPAESAHDLPGALRDGIRFVANLDPSQDDIPPRLAAN